MNSETNKINDFEQRLSYLQTCSEFYGLLIADVSNKLATYDDESIPEAQILLQKQNDFTQQQRGLRQKTTNELKALAARLGQKVKGLYND